MPILQISIKWIYIECCPLWRAFFTYHYAFKIHPYCSIISVQFSSFTQSCLTLCNPMDCSTPGLPVIYHLPEPAQTHVRWVSDAIQTILSSVIPFSSCLPPFLASGSFPMSWLFASGGQSIGASPSASVLLMNIQGCFPLGWTGLILLSKGLSKVFSNTTVQKHQFVGAQLSLWFNSHIHTWLPDTPLLAK